MRFTACPKEGAVWRSVSTGDWEPGLREHAARCPACREVALVSRGLAALARNSTDPAVLPDPRQIWWRARWLQSQAAAERATRPVVLYQRVAVAGAALGLGALGLLNWSWLWQWAPTLNGHWTLFGLAVPALPVTAMAAALLGVGALFTCRAALAED
jgi:hypothetical protein